MRFLQNLDLRDALSPRIVGAQIAAACRKARVVHVRANAEAGTRREFWDDALGFAGARVAVDEESDTGHPTGRLWSDVEFDPLKPNRFRHSCGAQPLHTDGSYVTDPPPIVFLVCKRPARIGGATIFLDGPELIHRLSSEQLQLFHSLTTEPIVFGKGGSAVESTVITHVSGAVLLRWNYYTLVPDHYSATAWLRIEAFRQFLEEVTLRCVPFAIRLQTGEAVFFHDDRVMHGRTSFLAEAAGDRCLWKGGLRI